MNASLLTTEIRRDAGVTLLDLRGVVIEHTGPMLEKAIQEVGEPHVLVNLEGVESMDSSGLASLLRIVRTQADRRLHFYNLPYRIRRVLDITGVAALFDIHETEADARAHVLPA